jgi:hypothetical protein
LLRRAVCYNFTGVSQVTAAFITIASVLFTALMVEAVFTYETSENTTQRNIREDSRIHTSRHENLKSHTNVVISEETDGRRLNTLTNSVAPEPEGSSPQSREPATGRNLSEALCDDS